MRTYLTLSYDSQIQRDCIASLKRAVDFPSYAKFLMATGFAYSRLGINFKFNSEEVKKIIYRQNVYKFRVTIAKSGAGTPDDLFEQWLGKLKTNESLRIEVSKFILVGFYYSTVNASVLEDFSKKNKTQQKDTHEEKQDMNNDPELESKKKLIKDKLKKVM